MDKVTATDVSTAIASHKIGRWVLRTCSICDSPLSYIFHADAVYFDPRCDCSSRGGIDPSSVGQVADTFNIQTPEVRQRMWDDFLAAGTIA